MPEVNRLKFLVLGKYARDIIGDFGENVKRLNTLYNVRISGLSQSQSRERVMQLDGSTSNCVKVFREILSWCPEVAFHSSRWPMSYSMNLLVGSEVAGVLVGHLQEITDQSGAMMRVYPDCLPGSNERVVAAGGDNVDTIIKALEVILEVLATVEDRGGTKCYQGGGQTMDPMGSSSYCSQGDHHSANTEEATRMDDNQTTPDENNIASALLAYRKSKRNIDRSWDFDNVETVTTLEMSADLCGAVFGKGAKNKRYIMKVSGAYIIAEKVQTAGKDERIVTLKGKQDQIQIAQQLMAHFVQASNVVRQQLQQQQPQQKQQQPQQNQPRPQPQPPQPQPQVQMQQQQEQQPEEQMQQQQEQQPQEQLQQQQEQQPQEQKEQQQEQQPQEQKEQQQEQQWREKMQQQQQQQPQEQIKQEQQQQQKCPKPEPVSYHWHPK